MSFLVIFGVFVKNEKILKPSNSLNLSSLSGDFPIPVPLSIAECPSESKNGEIGKCLKYIVKASVHLLCISGR